MLKFTVENLELHHPLSVSFYSCLFLFSYSSSAAVRSSPCADNEGRKLRNNQDSAVMKENVTTSTSNDYVDISDVLCI
ncbi:hypothetical protein Y032_0159g3278 [Ancylostoma ceylanicum]|uniref:Uncharacterized protein n=1 Tax=Ancylostoma ceylanicum TaxID=53326 RepID=A0A016SYK2_9BILA|nr:hypothetical protein Y032_0159g3278 [Ancylostoma ceylanicum]